VRWEALFADLEAQIQAEEQIDLEQDVADRARAERARVRLADRIRGHLGSSVTCRFAAGGTVTGIVADAGGDWMLIRPVDSRLGATLVPLAAVVGIDGLDQAPPAPSSTLSDRLGLAVVLRAVAGERRPVRVFLVGGGAVHGWIAWVAADHVDVVPVDSADHSLAARDRGARAVPLAAIGRVELPS
jgi:hypothetical protein